MVLLQFEEFYFFVAFFKEEVHMACKNHVLPDSLIKIRSVNLFTFEGEYTRFVQKYFWYCKSSSIALDGNAKRSNFPIRSKKMPTGKTLEVFEVFV